MLASVDEVANALQVVSAALNCASVWQSKGLTIWSDPLVVMFDPENAGPAKHVFQYFPELRPYAPDNLGDQQLTEAVSTKMLFELLGPLVAEETTTQD